MSTFEYFLSFLSKRGDESSGQKWESRHFVAFSENEAMRAVIEGGKAVLPWDFSGNEAMRAVVKGGEVFIFYHFRKMTR